MGASDCGSKSSFQTELFTDLSSNQYLNPLPDDKILDWSKLKAFADDKLNVTKMIISVFDRVENIVGKGEIACTSNFSFSHNVFQKASFPDTSKGVIEWEWVKLKMDINETFFRTQCWASSVNNPRESLIVWYLTPSSTVFQLYCSGQCTYPSMLSWSFFNQYYAQYFFQSTGCFST